MNRRGDPPLIRIWLGAFFLAAAFCEGCRSPRYVPYTSLYRDFGCEIPYGWTILLDSAGTDYTNVTFTGPFDPDFFRGTPSFSIRWYRAYAPHRLPDATYEMYGSAEDFRNQMLRDVYGPSTETWAGPDPDLKKSLAEGRPFPSAQRISISGKEASYFVVYRTLPAPTGHVFGVVRDEAGNRAVLQRHAYALLPRDSGFYVIVYPATRDGFAKHQPAFFHLLNTFKVFKGGPAGSSRS